MAPFLRSPVVAALRSCVAEGPGGKAGFSTEKLVESGKPRRAAPIRALRGGADAGALFMGTDSYLENVSV